MSAGPLLHQLLEQGLQLWADGEQLRFRAPRGALTEELRRQLREHKGEILALLGSDGRRFAPTSFGQEQLWLVDRLLPASPAYTLSAAWRLAGPLDVRSLEHALDELRRRHEALRTTFAAIDGQPVQVIHPRRPEGRPDTRLPVVDLKGLPAPARDAEARRQATIEAMRPMDLARGPLVRVRLIRLGDRDQVLLLTVHHIVTDGWSQALLWRRLGTAYDSYADPPSDPLRGDGRAPPETPRIRYADVAARQRCRLRGEVLEALLAYWRRVLEGAPTFELPADRPRPAASEPAPWRGAVARFALPPALCRDLARLGRGTGATLYMTLLAAFMALLHRLSGRRQILVGSPIAGRERQEDEGIVGFFIKALVMRGQLTGDPTFRAFLEQVRETALGAFAHQELPFERLVAELEPHRDLGRNPFFQITFALQNQPPRELRLRGLETRRYALSVQAAKLDLEVLLDPAGDGLEGRAIYRTDLFDRTTIERLGRGYVRLLRGLAASSGFGSSDLPPPSLGLQISRLSLLSRAEIHQLTREWSGWPMAARGPAGGIHQLFERQAERAPEAVALVFERRGTARGAEPCQRLSYGELNRRANRLAAGLIGHGAGPEVPVAICLERSLEMVVAALAVLKAGAAYLPLDPAFPPARTAYVLADAGARLLLTREPLLELFADFQGEILRVDPGHEPWENEPEVDPDPEMLPHHAAYVVYTSGSTGRPKGVIGTHRGFLAYLSWLQAAHGPNPDDVGLQLAPFTFDMSLRDLFGPLAAGGRTVLVDETAVAEPAVLLATMAEERVSVVPGIVPAVLGSLLDQAAGDPSAFESLRLLLIGGDRLTIADGRRCRELLDRRARLVNQYGTTESYGAASCDPLATEHRELRNALIGRPRAHASTFALAPRLQPVAAGSPGQLHVGGISLVRGYLNQPRLTAEKLVPDPFNPDPGARMYATGDLVRRRADGSLEYRGRVDHQVKIRGHRVEPGEIEAVLARHPAVRGCAVTFREEAPGGGRLVAWVVTGGTLTPPDAELRHHLSRRLPAAMVPATFVRPESLPVTANGKIDRRALERLPVPGPARIDLAAPRDWREEILAGIWSEVLGVEPIGIHDNFFELGGHSLLATQVLSRVRKTLGAEVPLQLLFAQPTIAELAGQIGAALRSSGSPDSPPPIAPLAPGRAGELPLSFSQQRLWFLQQLEPESSAYNLAAARRLRGELSVPVLARAFRQLVRRHELLRTVLPTSHERPYQLILSAESFQLRVLDLTRLEGDAGATEARRRLADVAWRPFDLSREPPLRVVLVRLAEQDHVLLTNPHHIACDGWSMGILHRELTRLYEAANDGEDVRSALPELAIRYADFAVWQRSWLQGEVLEAQLSYWRGQLAGSRPLELPTDRPRTAGRASRGAACSFTLSPERTRRLKRLSLDAGVSLFMTLLTVFQVFARRLSGQSDFAIGTAIANRHRRELEPLIGLFVNALVLRGGPAAATTLEAALARSRRTCLEAYAFQDLPFEKLVEEVEPERDLSRFPLFQVQVLLQNAPPGQLRLGSAGVSTFPLGASRTADLDLTLSFTETGERLAAQMRYDAGLFDRTTISRWVRNLAGLLAQVGRLRPDRPLSELSMLRAPERHQLLAEWNDTAAKDPGQGTVIAELEAQVRRIPDALAAADEHRQLTYGMLDARTESVAWTLIGRQVEPQDVVALLAERDVDYLIVLLALFKIGAVYLPLDVVAPPRRLAQVLTQAASAARMGTVRVIVADAFSDRLAATVRHLPDRARAVPVGLSELLAADAPALRSRRWPVAPDQLAYILFTSGSTGTPKGAMIEHRGMLNHMRGKADDLSQTAADVLAQTASQLFDISVWQFLGPLLLGGRVQIVPDEVVFSPPALLARVTETGVTILETTPTLMSSLLEELERRPFERPGSLRWYVPTGEALPPALARRWRERCPEVAMLNAYGFTETSDDVTHFSVSPRSTETGSIPVGRPIRNLRMRVLDRRGRPQSAGVAGDLHAAGAGVGRGYLADPARTAAAFVPDPFAGRAGERTYRTGDLAHWLPDGNLGLIGRIDHQVKIRGHRVEPGEIETVLARHDQVELAVVAVRRDAGPEPRLVAYLATGKGTGPEVETLRRFLGQRLPAYMVPSSFSILESLPLLPSGKVDRRALERLPVAGPARAADLAMPRDWREEILAGIWSEVLGVEAIGIHENFFELGGHSLLATQVISRLQVVGLELPLRALFEQPTVAGLGRRLDEARRRGPSPAPPPLEPGSPGAERPLSFAQERLWFLGQLEPASTAYNLASAWRLSGPLDVRALDRSLREIARRHEVLRARFPTVDGRPRQLVDARPPARLPVVDLGALAPERRLTEARELAAAEARRPFDLARGPLSRAVLLRLGERAHALLLTLHHIASDGWSQGLFRRELSVLYAAYTHGRPSPLPELPIRYADFARWQRRWLRNETLTSRLAYWRRQLADRPPALELPTDRPRGQELGAAASSRRGGRHRWTLDAPLTRELKKLGRGHGATLYMTLLAAFMVLLHRLSGRRRMLIGSPIAGRQHQETEGLIGFFVNTLVMRGEVAAKSTFAEHLSRVRETALGAYVHQELPFEKLVADLQPERDLTRNPLFQAMLTVHNAPESRLRLPGLTAENLGTGSPSVRFDLELNCWEAEGCVVASTVYRRDLFDATTVARLCGQLGVLLRSVARDPDRRIGTLVLLEEAQRHQLLVEWADGERRPAEDKRNHELFEVQAVKTPDAIALVFQQRHVTYRRLDQQANRLAHHLRAGGVVTETLVAVCLERSPDSIVALLAILKAGGAYLPLDPAHPAERRRAILRDAGVRHLVTTRDLSGVLSRDADRVVLLDEERSSIARRPAAAPAATVLAEQLAYCLYTSGSTGRPKGVAVAHRQIVHYVLAAVERYQIVEGASFALVLPLTVDAAQTCIFPALSTAGCIHVLSRRQSLDAAYLRDYFARRRIDLLKIAPSHLDALAQQAGPGKTVPRRLLVVGGESWRPDRLGSWLGTSSSCRVYNEYGPTEATVATHAHLAGPGSPAPARQAGTTIGSALARCRGIVADRRLRLATPGTVGELVLGGAGLARGYHVRAGLTARSFIPDPWSFRPGQRLYRSGDLVRFLPNGDLEILGRADDQVKIRGWRVEPGEIRSRLLNHPSVAQAAVVAQPRAPGAIELVAYVVAAGDVEPGALRDHLARDLPDYMLPAAMVEVPDLPQTSGGKVDRRALPAPEARRREQRAGFVAPGSPIEESLAESWGDLLGLERVGADENFFELGGHSLLAVRLMARIESRLRIDVPLAELFRRPTVRSMARYLAAERRAASRPAPGSVHLSSPLVVMNPPGRSAGRAPFFCVHPVGGHVLCYAMLARRLGSDQPFYGLQVQSHDGLESRHRSLEEMAGSYVEAVRSVRPCGPYHLGGWSMGGRVAWEMARQLSLSGHRIALLAVIDAPAPASSSHSIRRSSPGPGALAAGLRRFARDLGLSEPLSADLVESPRDVVLNEILIRGRRSGVLDESCDLDRLRRLHRLYRNSVDLMRRYAPDVTGSRPAIDRAVLFRAEEDSHGDANPELGWGAWLDGGLEVVRVPGNHTTILQVPGVERLAEHLGARLGRRHRSA